ncbi:MAG: phosphoribosylanthranilate isomerase [Ghiorsea sp.]
MNATPSALTLQPRVRIKLCGITRLEDALSASALGVDAIGFVFYKESPRYIESIKAAAIIRKLPPFISAVGLFVNPTQSEIDDVLHDCSLDVIQLHGNESPEFCLAQPRRVVKALPVATADDLNAVQDYACTVLLDAKAPDGVYGGTGHCFDWSLLASLKHDFPIILAGGLNAENVRDALPLRDWFAVDVSSGVEHSQGIKDKKKMVAFCKQVQTFAPKV